MGCGVSGWGEGGGGEGLFLVLDKYLLQLILIFTYISTENLNGIISINKKIKTVTYTFYNYTQVQISLMSMITVSRFKSSISVVLDFDKSMTRVAYYDVSNNM